MLFTEVDPPHVPLQTRSQPRYETSREFHTAKKRWSDGQRQKHLAVGVPKGAADPEAGSAGAGCGAAQGLALGGGVAHAVLGACRVAAVVREPHDIEHIEQSVLPTLVLFLFVPGQLLRFPGSRMKRYFCWQLYLESFYNRKKTL